MAAWDTTGPYDVIDITPWVEPDYKFAERQKR